MLLARTGAEHRLIALVAGSLPAAGGLFLVASVRIERAARYARRSL